MKSALILYPHQLFPLEQLPKVDTVLMVEEPLYFGIDREFPIKLHKQKLILQRASMRRYVEEVLWPAKIEVDYIGLDGLMTSEDIFERAKKYEQLYLIDPVDDVLTKRLLEARRANSSVPAFEFLPSPNFYLKNQEIQTYFIDKHVHVFADFYQWQRERFNILIGEDYKPVGGKWMFDSVTQKKIEPGSVLPSFEVFGDNKYVEEAVKYIEQHFSDHIGSTDFVWPTNHEEASLWLQDFVENRLDQYAEHLDIIDGSAMWLYHSALASSLNIGLLSPQQIVAVALARHQKRPVPLESLEAFIRAVLGWREFTRGQYLVQGTDMKNANPLKQQKRLTKEWYQGALGLPPFDDAVKKLHAHGYAHHTEKVLIIGGLMMLCEIHPHDMQRWFSQYFVDAFDWMTTPFVYSLVHFLDSNDETHQLPIISSEDLLKLSNYERGEWSDVWDGLFWRFVEKHQTVLKQKPATRAIVQRLEKLDGDHRRIVSYRAEDFLNTYTK